VPFKGPVNELAGLITKLLKEHILVPEITVVPPKVTVAEPELSVPLLTKLPLILRLVVGVNDPVMVMLPKTGAVLPVTDVVPENVIALDVKEDELLLNKSPFKSIDRNVRRFGALTARLLHPTAPVLLTKIGPLGAQIRLKMPTASIKDSKAGLLTH